MVETSWIVDYNAFNEMDCQESYWNISLHHSILYSHMWPVMLDHKICRGRFETNIGGPTVDHAQFDWVTEP